MDDDEDMDPMLRELRDALRVNLAHMMLVLCREREETGEDTPVHEHTIAEPAKWSITVTAVCEHCAEQITQTIADAWEHDDSGDIYCEGIWEDGGA